MRIRLIKELIIVFRYVGVRVEKEITYEKTVIY